MKIRYIGTSNYQEYPVTGTNALWQPEWVSDVSDSRATALVALGTFVNEDDSTYAKQLLDHAAEHAAMGSVPTTATLQMLIPGAMYVGADTVKDVSGNGYHLTRGTDNADDATGCFQYPGWFKTDESAGGRDYAYAAGLTPVWEMSSEWFIFAMKYKPISAAMARNVVSCAEAGVVAGWYLKVDATGKMYVVTVNSALAVGGNQASTPIMWAAGVEYHVAVAVCPVTKDIYLFLNGHLVNHWTNQFSGSGVSSRALTFGHIGVNVASPQAMVSLGCQYRSVQYYKGTGQLPDNVVDLAYRLYANQDTPLSVMDVVV